jgi:glyoxylase-like metal-dependent hydrolase (beta-lactamase superfamily II)
MRNLGIDTIVVGAFEVNCYVIRVDGACYIVDPGADADIIIRKVKALGLLVKGILLTHAHIDHISAAKSVSDAFTTPAYLNGKDVQMYNSPMNCMPPFYPVLKQRVTPINVLDDNDLEIVETPGHTQGGVCFYFKNQNVLFSGDTIFFESVGRTDLAGGNQAQLINSIQTKIFTLPDNTDVYPGHGEHTTVGHEKKYNPYAAPLV